MTRGRRQSVSLREREEKKNSTMWQLVLGDCVVTCIWVACSSVVAEGAEKLHMLTGISEVACNTALLVTGLALLAPVCSLFWGAMINPVNNIALVVSGKGGLFHNLMRMLGQLAGAVLGSFVATVAVPQQHQGKFHLLSGKVKDGLTLELGFLCEAVLVLVITLVFLYLSECRADSRNKSNVLLALVPHITTVFVCVVGSEFTGPSLNPYLSFAWNSIYQRHSMTEHLAVFWLGPATGAVLGALTWRLLTPAGTDVTKRTNRDRAAGKAAAKALARVKKD